jgi:protoporphyrinogen oxidase
MCEVFLLPYNEKQLAISLDDLSVEAVSRFFPYPDEKIIERGFERKLPHSTTGYNQQFWYPKQDGIGLLARGLAENLENLQTFCRVNQIDIQSRCLHTSQGKVFYNKLITSMPLKEFCANTNDSELRLLSKKLSHNRVLCINLLFRGVIHEDLQKCHWVYIPDKNLPFYRLGIYSYLGTSYLQSEHTAIYVEAAFDMYDTASDINKILNDVCDSLEKLDWVHRKDCDIISANWIDCAYVHFDHNRKEALSQILEILHNFNIYPTGRYGLWDYISMEDSIFSGIDVAERVSRI